VEGDEEREPDDGPAITREALQDGDQRRAAPGAAATVGAASPSGRLM
jgi:hypothetical protein